MQMSLSGHHVEITDALRSYVDDKFERLERHFDQVINVHVVLSVEKLRQKAEATIHVNGGSVFALRARSTFASSTIRMMFSPLRFWMVTDTTSFASPYATLAVSR